MKLSLFDGILAIILILGLLARLLYFGFAYDDAFITFRISQNIAEGKGFVYNEGEKVLATTSPLYTLLLAFIAKFFNDIVFISKIVGLAFYIFSCFVMLLLTKKLFGNPLPALFAILFFSFDFLSVLVGISGMETMFYIFFFLLTFYFYFEERENRFLWKSPIFLGIAFLIRPEALFVFVPIFVDQVITFKRRFFARCLVFALIALMTVSPWLLFSLHYFGSPLPSSFFTKSTENIYLGYSGIGYLFFHVGIFFLEIPIALFFASAALVSMRKDFKNYLMFFYLVLMIALYIMLNLSRYRWYYIPYFVIVFIYGGIGLYNFLKSLITKSSFKPFVTICLIVLITLGSQLVRHYDQLSKVSIGYSSINDLKTLAIEIYNETKGNTTIAIRDFGIIGFYSKAKILDYSGLATPESKPYIINGTVDRYLLSKLPEYIFIPKYAFERLEGIKTIRNNPEFLRNYELWKRFEYPDGNYLEVYRLVKI